MKLIDVILIINMILCGLVLITCIIYFIKRTINNTFMFYLSISLLITNFIISVNYFIESKILLASIHSITWILWIYNIYNYNKARKCG